MPENPFTFEILAEYSALFDGEIPELHALLTGISRTKLLQIAAFFLGFYNRKSVLGSPYELLSKFRPENNEFVNDLWKRIQALQNSSERKVRLINPQTALQLFEYAYDHLDDTETQTNVEIEVNIIKAVLVQNEINTRKQEQSGPTTEHITSLLRYPLWNLTQSFAYSELINYSITELWACQLIKSVSLFQFLASQEGMQPLLQAFLNYYHVTDWETYLKKVIPLTLSALKNQREAHTDIVVQQDEQLADNLAFLEKLIVKDEEALSDIDFRKTRSKPFLRVDELTYRIIFNPFVIETLYKGLYFKLYEINATLPGDVQFKNLRSLYTDAFSERWLLYRIRDNFFPEDNVKFTGSQIKDSGINAEPDYYARKNEDMYLFESKDILINAAVKEQYDFSLLEAEFKKKLYFEDKGGRRSNKAVLQLMGNIERALTMQFPFDTSYKPQAIKIYPVLVLHDHSFRVPGLNHLVNSWFIVELDKLAVKGFPTRRVRNLTIIDIDTLIYRQDIFREETFNLGEMISEYHQYVLLPRRLNETDNRTAGQIMNNKSIAFDTWLAGRLDKTDLNKPPGMLDAMTKIIFNSRNTI